MAENYPHRFFASLRWVGCEWRGLGGGLFWQFLCFFLGYSAPLLRKQIFPIPLIKYFPLLLCLSNIFLPFLLWDQMFTCPKIFLQNFPSSPKYHFPKFPGSPPLSKRAKSVLKIYLRTFLGKFVLVTLHFFLFYLVREGARGAPYDERSPSTVVDQSTGESHFKSLLICVYFVKKYEKEIRSKCISFALHRHLSNVFFLYIYKSRLKNP